MASVQQSFARNSPRKRVALVGAGYFSQFQLEAWASMDDVELVAVCDARLECAQAAATRFAVPGVFTEVGAMLDAVQPDLVDVVTPPASHAAVLSEVFERRLPAICQKPFGIDFAQACQLAEQAQRCGSLLVVHENFRFMPWYREARRLIDAGSLGTLHGISFRLRPGDGQGADAYLARQPYFQTMPRLLVAETAVHFIDTFRYLMGEVDAVYARLRKLNPMICAEDAGIITFEFQSGAAGLFDGNRLNDHVATDLRRTMGEMWLDGSLGVLRLDGDARLWWKPHQGHEVQHAYPLAGHVGYGGGACHALQRHVLDCMAQGVEPENSARAYLQNLRVQEAVYASHHSGRRIVMKDFVPANTRPTFATLSTTSLQQENS